jgi:hypothetical protein
MINISRRHPWALWPNSICPAFLDESAVDKLQGDTYWKVDVTFEYTGINMDKQKDIFCIVPKYTGLSIFEKRIFIGVGHDDKDDWHGTSEFIEPNTKESFTFEHFPNDKLVISRNGVKTLEYSLVLRPLAVVDDPIVFIGTDKHTVQDQSDETDIKFYEFKITTLDGVICHHDWQEIIHAKSVDKTGNCNFLYEMA